MRGHIGVRGSVALQLQAEARRVGSEPQRVKASLMTVDATTKQNAEVAWHECAAICTAQDAESATLEHGQYWKKAPGWLANARTQVSY